MAQICLTTKNEIGVVIYALFLIKPPYRKKQGEKSFQKTADRYPGLFEDLNDIFNGEKTENYYQSDISMVLYPLPKLPLLVCYWKAEEGMDSDLHLFFDSSADMNANIDIVYRITAGIVVMFEKIAIKHGV